MTAGRFERHLKIFFVVQNLSKALRIGYSPRDVSDSQSFTEDMTDRYYYFQDFIAKPDISRKTMISSDVINYMKMSLV